MKPDTAIIIPTLNEERTIGGLLDSLNKDGHKRKEIIIVDGGSSDRTREIAEDKGATVIEEEGEKCPANARNQGAEHTDADILCFLDADCSGVDKNFITNAIKEFDDGVGAVRACDISARDSLMKKILAEPGKVPDEFFTFVRRGVFFEAGGFPNIGLHEDRLYTENVRKALEKKEMKEKIAYDSVFFGNSVGSLREYAKQSIWYGRTVPFYIGKRGVSGTKELYKPFYSLCFALSFPVWPGFMPFAFAFVLTASVLIAKNIMKGWPVFRFALNLLGGVFMILGILEYVLGDRKKGRG